MYLIKPPVISTTEESSGSDSKSKKNTSADYSNYNTWTPNTFPKHVHLHKEDAVEGYVDGEEGNDDFSNDFVQWHIQSMGIM